MESLKPCPFCGQTDHGDERVRIRFYKSDKHYRVVCGQCGAAGASVYVQPWHSTKFVAQGQAVKAWNRRAGDLLETGDIAPVKRGKWIPDNDKSAPDLHMCSVCESISFRQEDNWGYDYGEELTPYCPYCGAKMDEDDN